MIQIRLADQEDFQRWDDYVRRNAEASPYHLIAWNLAGVAAYKHKQFYLIAEERNKICGVLPLCLLALPFSRGHLCSLPFCDIGGCLSEDDGIKRKLIDAALEIANRHRISTIHIRSRAAALPATDSEHAGKVSMLLSLPESSATLLASFKSKLRSQIRKAEKNGLTFRMGRDKSALEQFYHVLSSNMRDIGSPVHSKQWFESIRKRYAQDMAIGIVCKDEIPVGAGMLLFLENKAAIPWASTLSKYNHLAPNMLLYWGLLKYATDRHCTVFDFGRSSYGEGTYKFKKQWGARAVPLEWKIYSVGGKLTAAKGGSKRMRRIFESLWRRLPLQISNVLGPYIRKYISL